jgi:hypothetical protein
MNHLYPLPRTLANLVGNFTSAIQPFEADFTVLWGLVELNLKVRDLPNPWNLRR